MANTYEVYYDKDADFLEIFFGDPSECYADELEQGVFVRKDEETNDVKSIGIVGFRKRADVLRDLLNKLDIVFPIDFKITN